MHSDNVGQQFPHYGSEGRADIGMWRTHALGERSGQGEDKEPGAKWDRYTALVPVSTLARFAEFDRTNTESAHPHSARTIESISGELKRGGPEAIKEPLWIKYDHKNNWGVLVEGNHRLAAAARAGVTHLPVAVTTGANLGDHKKRRVGSNMNIDTRIVEKHGGYMPSTVHPGNFKQFEGSR